jgi:type I restriction enzyme S subunit
MKYPRYRAYKDSGVEWIGEIPEDWDLIPLKRTITIMKGKVPKKVETDVPEANDYLPYLSMEFLRGEPSKQWARVDNSTIVVDKSETLLLWDGSNAGEFIKSRRGILSSTVALIHSSKVNNNFLFHFCKAAEHKLKELTVGMGIPHVDGDLLKSFIIPFPSDKEQVSIGKFLDCKMTIIDNVVSKLQNMINMLKEKRQAIITKAVTKGLDPNVSMKDSGVEWIGEIPEHWNIQKLKRIFQVLNGSTPKSDNPLFWNGNIIWVTPEDLSLTVSSVICKSSRQITAEGYDSCGTNLVPNGSIIVSTRAPIGYVKIAGVELCTNQGCRSLVKKTVTNEKYLFYYLSSFGSVLNSLGQGSTFAELSSENLKMFQTPIPPIVEQITITRFLASETSKIDGLISKHLKLIDLLKEYKTSLITQAVTGKIDVRGIAISTDSNSA